MHFGNLRLAPGTYEFQFALTALTNPARTSTLTSPTFTVGAAPGGRHGRSAGTPSPAHCRHGHGHGKHGCGGK